MSPIWIHLLTHFQSKFAVTSTPTQHDMCDLRLWCRIK